MKTFTSLLLASLMTAAVVAPASATPIATTLVRASTQFSGMTTDAATGVVYARDGYQTATIKRFANAAAFESNVVQGTFIASNGAGGAAGNYLAAENGSVYLHTTTAPNGGSAVISKVSGVNGALQQSTTVAGMGTSNFSDAFDWGGYSVINPMNDGTNLLIVGGVANSSDWRISTFDYNLNQVRSVVFNAGAYTPGFAFAINNNIFFGDNFSSGQISKRVNATTGAVSNVDFTMTNISNYYMANVSYDAFNDALYVGSHLSLYKVNGASQAFGVANAVPEPSSILLMGLAFAGFAVVRRRQKGAAAN